VAKSDTVRRTIFDYLTQTRNKLIDSLLDYDHKHNPASTLAKYSTDLIDHRSNLGNYPILRILLNFNTLDFLNVIAMSFSESSFEAVIGLDKKQHLIDILIEIGLNSTGFNYQLAGHLFTFLARQIAHEGNNVKVEDMVFSQIIDYLCSTDDNDRIEEREQTLLGLLNAPSARTLERFSQDRLLSLALKAKFFRTCEILYDLRGEYCEIIDCYLNSENSSERQNKVFGVVRGVLQRVTQGEIGGELKKQLTRADSVADERDVQLRELQRKLIRYDTLRQMINIK